MAFFPRTRHLSFGFGAAALALLGACTVLKSGEDAGTLDDAGTPDAEVDTATPSTGGDDAGADTAAPKVDAATEEDAGPPIQVEVVMSGVCDVTWNTAIFQGPPQFTTSMGVRTTATGEYLALARKTLNGMIALSTNQRQADGDVFTVFAKGQLFQNACNVTAGPCTYSPATKLYSNDPVGGLITVNRYDTASAELDIVLKDVVLQSATSGDLCTINGRIRARGKP
jgi:hypothetical protein